MPPITADSVVNPSQSTLQTLLLLNSQIVSNPAHVESLTQQLTSSASSIIPVHRQVLDRVLSGMAPLPENSYSLIYIAPLSLNDAKEEQEEQEEHEERKNPTSFSLDSNALAILYAALALGGKLSGALNFTLPSQTLDAIMAGFMEAEDKKSFVKASIDKSHSLTSIPLRQNVKVNGNGNSHVGGGALGGMKKRGLPVFKKLNKGPAAASLALRNLSTSSPEPVTSNVINLKRDSSTLGLVKLSLTDLDDLDDDDDLLDENSLIAQSAQLSNPIIIPPQCDPGMVTGDKKRRRKACKDCTCGLRELELQEEEAQLAKQNQTATATAVVTINVDDAEEIDFTVPGKVGGSCGSCALGDAFRCDGCPYLGLPRFKPGEIVDISSIKNDF